MWSLNTCIDRWRKRRKNFFLNASYFTTDAAATTANDATTTTSSSLPLSSSPATKWIQLEGRLAILNSHMTHSIHVHLEDVKRSQLELLYDDMEHVVKPALILERQRPADARRQFDLSMVA